MIDFNVLIDFEWHRDRKGYHLAPRNSLKASPRPYDMRDDEIVIVPNGRH